MSSSLDDLFGRAIIIHEATLRLCKAAKSPYETAAFLERLLYFQDWKIKNGQEPWVYDSRKVLCDVLQISERQLRNAITYLYDLQLLTTERRLIAYGGSIGSVTHYQIDLMRFEELLQDMNATTSVDLTDVEQVERPTRKGQIDRCGPVSLTLAQPNKTSDAYKGTKSLTKNQSKSLSSPLPPSGDGGSAEAKPVSSPKARKTAAKKQEEVADEKQPAEHKRVMTILVTAIYGSEENTPAKTWPRIAAISKVLRERHSADEIDYLIHSILRDGFWRGKLSTANIEERIAIAAGSTKTSYANTPEAQRKAAREKYGDCDEILGVI